MISDKLSSIVPGGSRVTGGVTPRALPVIYRCYGAIHLVQLLTPCLRSVFPVRRVVRPPVIQAVLSE